MRNSTRVLLTAGAVGAGAALYSGFPTRVGLTASQALVSMPGDLVFPSAPFQGDRVVDVDATAQEIWPFVLGLRSIYEDSCDVPLDVLYEERPTLIVWQTRHPVRDEGRGQDIMSASVAVAVRPLGENRSRIHVRERYVPAPGRRAKLAALAQLSVTAFSVGGLLRQMRRALREGK